MLSGNFKTVSIFLKSPDVLLIFTVFSILSYSIVLLMPLYDIFIWFSELEGASSINKLELLIRKIFLSLLKPNQCPT